MRHLFWLALAPAALSAQATDSSRTRRDSTQKLEAVHVSAIRARDAAPVASTTLDRAELDRRSFGQDVPLLLQGSPSLTSYAETGGWGYSYFRLRGIDQSRINITLDGIPLNDPEDQVLYFADFPDLGASIGSVQVQRGVGTSAPGTASYGGSINLESTPVAGAPRDWGLTLQAGSFGSLRSGLDVTVPLDSGRFTTRVRTSAISSFGYRRHSDMTGQSWSLRSAWTGERDIVKLTALAGLFRDKLAYVGATGPELVADRRANILRPDEQDRFGEQVIALQHARAFGANSSLATTLYRTSASGSYEVCIANCANVVADLWRFHLDFAWYGASSVVSLGRGRARVTTGVNANSYARDHYAYDMADLTARLYTNTGHKRDASAFTRVEIDAGRTTLFADVQGRRAEFEYTPDAAAGLQPASIAWSFLNPKAGASFRVSPAVTTWASYGINGREPARGDMFSGLDNVTSGDTAFLGPLSRVRPERVHDVEAGVRWREGPVSFDANLFAMNFRNEILPVGQLNYIGLPLRKNASSSWRRGIEIDVSSRLGARLRARATGTFTRARIGEFIDDSDTTTYRDVTPLLTPAWTSTMNGDFAVTPALSIGATQRYVGRSYLNNTESAAARLPAYSTIDLAAHWTRGRRRVSLFVNNVLNDAGYASGHMSFGEARYYVLPPLSLQLLFRFGAD